MRIAMISYHTCPLATLGGKDTGGMNVYVRDLTLELGRQGIGVDVFTRSQDEHVPHVLHDLGYGNRIVHIQAGPENPLSKTDLTEYLGDFVRGIKEFVLAKGETYDLIHSHYWLSGLAALSLSKTWEMPLIHMFHTLAAMKDRVARSPEEVPSDERLQAEIRLLEEADRIIAATQAEMAQIQWLYRADTKKVVIIPPGVDSAHFYPIPKDEAGEVVGSPPGKRMLLYVGRIEPLKGVDTLLEAFVRMKECGFLDQHPVCLTIIGGDPEVSSEVMTAEMDRLWKLRETHGLEEMVLFLGKRDQDHLPYYYSAAEVVVVPSHYESFGMVALEAMACGTPVVASETGGLAFLVRNGETGFHVPAADSEALAARLIELLQDDELRQKMGSQAAEYAKKYSWSVIIDQILDVYSTTLSAYESEPA